MGKLTPLMLLLTGLATFVLGARLHPPTLLAAAALLSATAMFSGGVYLLITEEQFLR